MREGSRERVRGLFRPSITDTSFVLEGPLGRSKNGSWLISARKSYLGSIIRKIDPENTFGFGFHDLQAKAVHDLSPKHQVQFAVTVGRSRLNQKPDSVDIDEVQKGVNDVGVVVFTWRYLVSPRFIFTQKLAADGNTFRNVNLNGLLLQKGRRDDLIFLCARANEERTRGDCTGRACRSLDAHRSHRSLAMDRNARAAIRIVDPARRRRRLSPGA